jgi:hypothetical protein
MKKKYSDPLMFCNVLLVGPDIEIGTSPEGGSGPLSILAGSLFSGNGSGLSISGTDNNAAASGDAADVQIVEPAQASEATVTEESIQSVIDQILGEETETVPSDESSIAD